MHNLCLLCAFERSCTTGANYTHNRTVVSICCSQTPAGAAPVVPGAVPGPWSYLYSVPPPCRLAAATNCPSLRRGAPFCNVPCSSTSFGETSMLVFCCVCVQNLHLSDPLLLFLLMSLLHITSQPLPDPIYTYAIIAKQKKHLRLPFSLFRFFATARPVAKAPERSIDRHPQKPSIGAKCVLRRSSRRVIFFAPFCACASPRLSRSARIGLARIPATCRRATDRWRGTETCSYPG